MFGRKVKLGVIKLKPDVSAIDVRGKQFVFRKVTDSGYAFVDSDGTRLHKRLMYQTTFNKIYDDISQVTITMTALQVKVIKSKLYSAKK